MGGDNGGSGGGSEFGGGGADPGSGGRAGSGGTTSVGAIGTLGEPCGPNGAPACSGHARKQQLVCDDGEWAGNGTCSGNENCDTSEANAGSCQPILAECAGKQAGDAVASCIDEAPQVCGADLVTLVDGEPCEFGCMGGECVEAAAECEGRAEGAPVAACVDNAIAVCGPNLVTLEPGTDCGAEFSCVNGGCVPIVEGCVGKEPGDGACSADGTARFVCGPNLTLKVDEAPCDEGWCSAGACGAPRSCAGFDGTCGANGDGDCCEILPVEAGDYLRGENTDNPASVSAFRLDKYEVTVGRFRKFVAAVVGGWFPSTGSGKHAHLNGGDGLAVLGGGFEPGWDESLNVDAYGLYSGVGAQSAWNVSLSNNDQCTQPTWTTTPAENEALPVACVNWYQALAFCIWDDGFLPTETEWEYVAAGGAEERVYPWGSLPPGDDPDLAIFNCTEERVDAGTCDPDVAVLTVGSRPDGDGFWGHSDLGGSMSEWTLDWRDDPTDCTDCVQLTANPFWDPPHRVYRGGSWESLADRLRATFQEGDEPLHTHNNIGLRCARTP